MSSTINPAVVDSYGFALFFKDEEREEKRLSGGIKTARLLVGRNQYYYSRDRCKELCRYLQKTDSGLNRSRQAISQVFWCSTCRCVMRCRLCRCCGSRGRSANRKTRISRMDVKRI